MAQRYAHRATEQDHSSWLYPGRFPHEVAHRAGDVHRPGTCIKLVRRAAPRATGRRGFSTAGGGEACSLPAGRSPHATPALSEVAARTSDQETTASTNAAPIASSTAPSLKPPTPPPTPPRTSQRASAGSLVPSSGSEQQLMPDRQLWRIPRTRRSFRCGNRRPCLSCGTTLCSASRWRRRGPFIRRDECG